MERKTYKDFHSDIKHIANEILFDLYQPKVEIELLI
jgi:hypothetical protein